MLRQALRADLPRVVETWVDAFSADPYLRWVAPDDQTTVRPMERPQDPGSSAS